MGVAFNRAAAALESLVAAASQERGRLTAALNSSTDAVVAVDAQTRVAFANSAAGRLLGREAEIEPGSPFVWLVPDQDLMEALRSSGEEARSETRIIERPNREFFRVIVTPIVGGGDWSSLVVFQDLTDVKRVEQVRRDFAANVSHELRTPLAALKAVIETLQVGALEDEPAARGFLAQADGEVDRLVQMVEELLELSLIESGEVPLAEEPVQVSDVIASAVERLRPQAQRQKLHLSLSANGGATVRGDRVRLERAVVNLIHNALKFTPEGGSVQVSAVAADGGVLVRVEHRPRPRRGQAHHRSARRHR
jgi:two-component system phosphate regulon sensor histidine kinase PhoR